MNVASHYIHMYHISASTELRYARKNEHIGRFAEAVFVARGAMWRAWCGAAAVRREDGHDAAQRPVQNAAFQEFLPKHNVVARLLRVAMKCLRTVPPRKSARARRHTCFAYVERTAPSR